MERQTKRNPFAAATALIIIAAVTEIVTPQQTPSTPTTPLTCTNAFLTLLPCVGYVTGGNDTASPSCCSGFVAVIVNGAAPCLCQFLGTGNPLGFPVNQTQVPALPAACNVNISSLPTQCAAIGFPLNPSSPAPAVSLAPPASPLAGLLPPFPIPGLNPAPTASSIVATNGSSPPVPLTAESPLSAPAVTPGDSTFGPATATPSDNNTNIYSPPPPAARAVTGTKFPTTTGTSSTTADNGASVNLTPFTGGINIALWLILAAVLV